MSSFWIDAVILLLLALALIWGAVLARRIARLQAALIDLAPALQAFCDAVDQSEQSVREIRAEADRLQASEARRATPEAASPVGRNAMVRSFFETARKKAMG